LSITVEANRTLRYNRNAIDGQNRVTPVPVTFSDSRIQHPMLLDTGSGGPQRTRDDVRISNEQKTRLRTELTGRRCNARHVARADHFKVPIELRACHKLRIDTT
jgi:hypothetical protein